MHVIETTIDINASAEQVWAVLSDFSSHPKWNPFIRSIEGELLAGSHLNVLVQPPGGKGMRFNPVVLVAKPGEE